MVSDNGEKFLTDILPVYYARFFPHKSFCRWISCGNSPQPLANRELSFTLADDVYLRYLSINNLQEFQTLLQHKKPLKLDIGAVYNTNCRVEELVKANLPIKSCLPTHHNGVIDVHRGQGLLSIWPSIGRHDAVVLARELVFDIDLTDYDEVRTCCQEAKVCDKCWKFMVIACEVLHTALRDDFGFQSILWVFSGRRGIHCWVSDYEARTLDSPGRAAVADYLCLITGGDNQVKKVHLQREKKLHSSIRRAVGIIDKYFKEMLDGQQFLSTSERLKQFLKMIPDETLRNQVEKALEKMPESSVERWDTFVDVYEQFCKENGAAKWKYLLEEIKLQYCYPRLDVNVTKGFNHLLKSPFSIHPKTGKVSVVFKPEDAKGMKLEKIPTIETLLDDSSVTSEEYMDAAKQIFTNFVYSLERAEAIRKRTEASKSLDF